MSIFSYKEANNKTKFVNIYAYVIWNQDAMNKENVIKVSRVSRSLKFNSKSLFEVIK